MDKKRYNAGIQRAKGLLHAAFTLYDGFYRERGYLQKKEEKRGYFLVLLREAG